MRRFLALGLLTLVVFLLAWLAQTKEGKNVVAQGLTFAPLVDFGDNLKQASLSVKTLEDNLEFQGAVLETAGGTTALNLTAYYFLFGQPDGQLLAVDPLNRFEISSFTHAKLGSDLELEGFDRELVKVMPEDVLAIVENNNGNSFAKTGGDFKMRLFLAKPRGGVLAWYATYQERENLLQLAVNASSGAILK